MEFNTKPFGRVEGAFAILSHRNILKQVDVYTRNGVLFAKHMGGFISIMSDGKTSKADVSCKGLGGDVTVKQKETYGKLEVDDGSV